MRGVRFSTAIAAAGGAHLALLALMLVVPAGRARATEAPSRAPAPELLFVTEEVVAPAPTSEPPPVAPETEPSVRSGRARVASPPAASDRPTRAEPPELPDVLPAPASPAPSASVNLGIGDYWRSVAMTASLPAPSASAPSEPPPRSLDRVLRDALDESDHAMGLGPAGPLVGAAHEAASIPSAPDTGTALFDVESDASGAIVRVTLVANGATDDAWNDVGREIQRLLAQKRLHVPQGQHGVRARLRIAAERTLPAGEKLTRSIGAVADDIPTGEKWCEGTGIFRKCLNGSPVGASGTWGDFSNIGQRRTRAVHAQIVSEETF